MAKKKLKYVKRKPTIKLPKPPKIKFRLFKNKSNANTAKDFVENIKKGEKSLIGILLSEKKSRPIKPTLVIPEIKRISAKGDLIETKIDELYNLISKNGKISTNEAAVKLNVKREEVENWAQILFEHNLIDIDYPAVGKTIMIKK